MGYSFAQLEGIWIQAGGNPAAAPIAAAVALAESGGNPSAHNGNASTGDDSWGLWQVNMLGSMGAARRTQFGITSNSQLTDPATNAKAAIAISSNGANWTPWTTYTSGAYQKFVQGGVTPNMTALGAGGSATSPQATLTSNPLDPSTWTSAIGSLLENIGNYVYMGVVVVGGAAIVVVALMFLTFESPAGKAVVSAATSTIGRVI